ncbi:MULTISPECIES: hypothetical protein [Arthrobacter]|uniref:Uncharacterized protein n=1 Tax=Arthrobacter terricola TaxID=2547396 RepID=A0A4R5KF22_9MICC|nr:MULTISPECIES: hypothetical protein [Arthrobacter]MBT8162597.1 hypothetical protein [Arthrobacter sp. GN70]TDF92847.1 hypothetical protein E1809_16945 [Arthrobacter terricola]
MVQIEHVKQRRATASVMVALSIAGIAILIATGIHPSSAVDGFLVLTLSTFGIISIFRAWQLGTRPGRVYVPTLKPWKRILLVILLLISGGIAGYLYFSYHGSLILAVFLFFAANLLLMLLFDFVAKTPTG